MSVSFSTSQYTTGKDSRLVKLVEYPVCQCAKFRSTRPSEWMEFKEMYFFASLTVDLVSGVEFSHKAIKTRLETPLLVVPKGLLKHLVWCLYRISLFLAFQLDNIMTSSAVMPTHSSFSDFSFDCSFPNKNILSSGGSRISHRGTIFFSNPPIPWNREKKLVRGGGGGRRGAIALGSANECCIAIYVSVADPVAG